MAGSEGVNACPYGSVPMNVTECRQMPIDTGGSIHKPFIIDSDKDPRGCFSFQYNKKYNWFYFNTHHTGVGRSRRKVYCKRLIQQQHEPGEDDCAGSDCQPPSQPPVAVFRNANGEKMESVHFLA